MFPGVTVPASLEHTVDAFWSFISVGGRARILPDGCMDFVFDLSTATARLVGSMTSAEIVAPPRGAHYFGVRFLPGVAALLVDARACELTDLSVELTTLLPASSRSLPERIAEARSDAERGTILEGYLTQASARLRSEDERVRAATAKLAQTGGALRVSELAASVGVSERQLERLFQERVGLRPKVFARVMRLQRAVALLERPAQASPRWPSSQAALALAAGYADEPHLLRDFRELAAATPGELAREHRVGFVQDGARERMHAPDQGEEP
jgi:AraC-like DNA-binding protein